MENFLEAIRNLPEIFQQSQNTLIFFGVVSVLLLAFVLFSVRLYSSTKVRALLLTLLFCLGLVLAGLSAGVLAGFKTGDQAGFERGNNEGIEKGVEEGIKSATEEFEQNPDIVELPVEVVQALEEHLESSGLSVTQSNKVSTLSEAVKAYVDGGSSPIADVAPGNSEGPSTAPLPERPESSQPTAGDVQAGEPAELENITITFPTCNRSPSNIVDCNFFVRPKRSLWLFLRCQYQSSGVTKAFDPAGGDHNCSRVQLGNRTDERQIYQVLPSTNVQPKAIVSFRSIPPDITQISSLQIYYNVKLGTGWSGSPYASADYTFDNVPITSASASISSVRETG